MRLTKAACCVALGAAAVASGADGPKREAVLKQIKVPHPYYFREMYLPQVTSGPSGLAWFPDGKELVLSMQGSLWRHVLGTPVATQLTDGPGYDYQPDVSPDGRTIIYASYRNDAVDLAALDLTSGESRVLVSDGSVNVEPRFSPDGKRVAFVSTAFEGRWHVFVLDLARGARPIRISPDNDGGLPRYYYGKWDHAISPTWSADGTELLVVSNRGRVWGTGGFWRMKAEPDGAMREIRHEETNWKARPDWSRDGKRIVYASYLGRNWHQLWLMTSEGGDVFPISYGDFDATAPRWSPDSTRIAYVSNEGGDTHAEVVAIPGGAHQRVDIRERRRKNPTGRLRIIVKDGERPTPARVSVVGPDGRSYAPDDAWRHADEAFSRAERRIEHGYYHTSGQSEVAVPANVTLRVEVTRGVEYTLFRRDVRVAADATLRIDVPLRRLDDLPKKGWWSGDLHVHMNYGGAYRNDPRRLALQASAEDVHVVENLIVNKEQRIPDVAHFTGRLDASSTATTLISHGQEFHTSVWGHLGLLGLTKHLILPDYAGYANTPAASLYPSNGAVADLAHAQGGLVGYVHPFDVDPEPGTLDRPLTNAIPVDAALGKIDYYEVLGFVDDYWPTARVWYRLLNCGFRLPAGAGTDAMANYASLRGPVGLNRVFVQSGPKLDYTAWHAALKAGRTFATNGPLLSFSIDGRKPGDEITLGTSGGTLRAHVEVASYVPVDRIEIVGNGEVVANVSVQASQPASDEGPGTLVRADVTLSATKSGWYVLRAWNRTAAHPVLDLFPYASTSPIYVTVGGKPVRSAEDARYFLAWIDRLAAFASSHQAWNTADEKAAALAEIGAARAVFAQRF